MISGQVFRTVNRDMAENVQKEYGVTIKKLGAIGFSAMMHGYMAFDKEGKLLAPFQTWRNSNTRKGLLVSDW